MFGCIQIVRANPSVLIVRVLVSEPLDVVPELRPEAPVDLGVNNLFNFEV